MILERLVALPILARIEFIRGVCGGDQVERVQFLTSKRMTAELLRTERRCTAIT
jgi:hypothetical protein